MNWDVAVELSNGQYISLWFSDNDVGEDSEDCDSVIGYNLYDSERNIIDGGEMDYNYGQKNYNTIEDAIDDIIDFIEIDILFYRILERDRINDFE